MSFVRLGLSTRTLVWPKKSALLKSEFTNASSFSPFIGNVFFTQPYEIKYDINNKRCIFEPCPSQHVRSASGICLTTNVRLKHCSFIFLPPFQHLSLFLSSFSSFHVNKQPEKSEDGSKETDGQCKHDNRHGKGMFMKHVQQIYIHVFYLRQQTSKAKFCCHFIRIELSMFKVCNLSTNSFSSIQHDRHKIMYMNSCRT